MPRKMAREPNPIAEITSRQVPAVPRKIGTVQELLRREEGATLDELVKATSWLPHTTRAALTGLRRKGHRLERSKRDDATCYRIVEAGQ
jgi:hypothetical protein